MNRNFSLPLNSRSTALKGLWWALALAVPGPACAETHRVEPDAERLQAAARQLAIRWIGGATMHLQFGPISIITDPVLADSFRMIDPNTGEPDARHYRLSASPDPAGLDAQMVLLSHNHPDHFDDAALVLYHKQARFLVPSSQTAGLAKRGIEQVEPLAWHQTFEIVRDGFRVAITALPAQHSERADLTEVLGEVNAYWIEFQAGDYRRSLYWTGDSFFVPALSSWPGKPDVFVPHLGAVGTGGPFGQVSMNARQAIEFTRLVAPRAVLPIHHSTFSLYREPITDFLEAAHGQTWDVLSLEEGTSIVIE